MPYVVVLDLGAGGSRIADICDALQPGVETVARLGAMPHLSLAIYEDVRLEACIVGLRDFAATTAPVPIRLAGLGVFAATSHVLFAAPVVTEDLLALHRRFHDAFAPPGAVCQEHYRPGNWVPHITLALNLSREQLRTAIETVATRWTPFSAELDAVRLIRYPPVETLFHQTVARSSP